LSSKLPGHQERSKIREEIASYKYGNGANPRAKSASTTLSENPNVSRDGVNERATMLRRRYSPKEPDAPLSAIR